MNTTTTAEANHLANAGTLSHARPGGKKLAARLHLVGYAAVERVEDLTSLTADATRLISLWRASPGHNRNMMSPAYRGAGIGPGTSNTVDYWVLIIAPPAASDSASYSRKLAAEPPGGVLSSLDATLKQRGPKIFGASMVAGIRRLQSQLPSYYRFDFRFALKCERK